MPAAGHTRVNRVVSTLSARAVARPSAAKGVIKWDAAVGRAGGIQGKGVGHGGTAGDAPWQWVDEGGEVTGMATVFDGGVR
jgi:hypothetical protein